MTENQRLKIFRKAAKLQQNEFAVRLNMKPGSLSDIERGKVGVSTKVKKLLELEFLCNIEWLETGEGKMFIETDENIISESMVEYNIESPWQKIINTQDQLIHQLKAENKRLIEENERLRKEYEELKETKRKAI